MLIIYYTTVDSWCLCQGQLSHSAMFTGRIANQVSGYFEILETGNANDTAEHVDALIRWEIAVLRYYKALSELLQGDI